jgi:DNA polymerase III subunit delta'
VVDPIGRPPFPWHEAAVRDALALRGAHAQLLHGQDATELFELAMTLARAWLCESGGPSARTGLPCGVCSSCRMCIARSHPDMLVLLPDAMRESLGWSNVSTADDETAATTSGRSKPSREIKVEDVRVAIAFAQSTSARGVGRVVVLYPGDRMNVVAAHALLKTLEEPFGQTRFLLCSTRPDTLLPTIRSRCQAFALRLAPPAEAIAWLEQQGVEQAEIMLAACGGCANDVLDSLRRGVDAATWLKLPQRVLQRDTGAFADWTVAQMVDALQRLAHDCTCVAIGAAPRYFPAQCLPTSCNVAVLTQWGADLRRDARFSEHPWNAALKLDSLLQAAQRAMLGSRASATHTGPPGREAFVHSAP